MRSLRLVAAATLFVCAFAAAAPAHAGGFHISILGARRSGMLTNIANPDDLTALFANPAGLAAHKGTQVLLSSGFSALSSSFQLQALDASRFPEINAGCGDPRAAGTTCPWPIGSDGYYTQSISPERASGVIPYLGISQDLGVFSPALKDVTVSAAFYAPGAYGASLSETAPTAYYVLDGFFVIGAATAGLGWRINDVVSIGGSFSYNYRRLQFAQKFSLADVLTPAGMQPDVVAGLAQGTLGDLRLEYAGVDHGLGWGLGALITPTDWMSIGLAYSGFTNARFQGDLDIGNLGSAATGSGPKSKRELNEIVNGFGYKLPTGLSVEMVIPPSFSGGVSFFPAENLELAVDFRLWLYSIFEKQTLEPRYEPGPGKEPLSKESLSKDKLYHDSWELSAGAKWRPWAPTLDLDLMLGVAYDRSPTPDATFSIDSPSMDQVVLAAGARLGLGSWRLGLAYMALFYVPRDITNSTTSPPTNLRIRGINNIPTLEVSYRF
jgi:long-chain fatty acid transport protein